MAEGYKGYSYEELTTPPILKFRRRMERQLNKVAQVIEKALKDEDINIKLKASDRAVNWAGAESPKKTELSGTDGQPITVIVKKFSEDDKDDKDGSGSSP
jgi:hypothetical protein